MRLKETPKSRVTHTTLVIPVVNLHIGYVSVPFAIRNMCATFILLVLSVEVEASRILFYPMHSSRSHIVSMLPFAERLMQAGHDVHFFEATQRKEHFSFPYGISNHHFRLSNRTIWNLSSMWTETYSPWGFDYVYRLGDDAFFELISEHSDEVTRILNKTWDIVFADELFAMGSFGIALRNKKIFKKPYVMLSTTVILQYFTWELALGRNFLCQPSSWTPFSDDIHFDVTNMVHRWSALYAEAISGISIKFGIECRKNKGLATLGINDFSFTDLWTNAAYIFQEEMDYLAFPTPISNDVLNIGSYCPQPNHLPLDLREFIEDSSSKGTIYIAMGTNVKWANAPLSITAAFKYVMRELHQYRIIFVNDNDSLQEMPSHVKVLNWAPQFDILNHNKTILFISHGGLKSIKESICTKTPMLFIPIFADQAHNAAIGAKLGFTRSLNKLTLNNEKLLVVAREMLSNNRYMDSVSRMHDIFLDRPMNSIEEAVFWTNRILRLAGRKNTFKRKGMSLSLIDFFYLLHIAFLVLFITVLCKN
uniref:UDP-glucuronosyltransferase n=2 Tax=Parascaris univalens TaxID=6257 RepID=A0A914ZHZ7_PARUN